MSAYLLKVNGCGGQARQLTRLNTSLITRTTLRVWGRGFTGGWTILLRNKADKSALFDGVCVFWEENMISLWFECRFSLQSGCSPESFDASTSHQGNCYGRTSCDNHGNQLGGADAIRCVCASLDWLYHWGIRCVSVLLTKPCFPRCTVTRNTWKMGSDFGICCS